MDKEMLDLYADYLISQNSHATATGLSALLDGEISHDKVTRFLSEEPLGSKGLWQLVKPEVRRCERADGVIILDDMIEEKAYTDENEIMCWHFSHAKHRHMKGANILSCLVRYGEIGFPIGFEVVTKDVLFSELETQRESNRTVALSESDKQQGQFQKLGELTLEEGQARMVYLRGLDFPVCNQIQTPAASQSNRS